MDGPSPRHPVAPTRRAKARPDPASWTSARRAAVAQLFETPGIRSVTLAVALGSTVRDAPSLFRSCGLVRRQRGRAGTASPAIRRLGALSTEALERALRDHIARQIARFDEVLRDDAAPALDSARVLRDLGGLKRLLDDLTAGERERAHATSRMQTDGDGPGDESLAALRAAIAARYATGLGERADAGLPGEPAAGADPGAGLGLAP